MPGPTGVGNGATALVILATSCKYDKQVKNMEEQTLNVFKCEQTTRQGILAIALQARVDLVELHSENWYKPRHGLFGDMHDCTGI